jgi:hypothetical protein
VLGIKLPEQIAIPIGDPIAERAIGDDAQMRQADRA